MTFLTVGNIHFHLKMLKCGKIHELRDGDRIVSLVVSELFIFSLRSLNSRALALGCCTGHVVVSSNPGDGSSLAPRQVCKNFSVPSTSTCCI